MNKKSPLQPNDEIAALQGEIARLQDIQAHYETALDSLAETLGCPVGAELASSEACANCPGDTTIAEMFAVWVAAEMDEAKQFADAIRTLLPPSLNSTPNAN